MIGSLKFILSFSGATVALAVKPAREKRPRGADARIGVSPKPLRFQEEDWEEKPLHFQKEDWKDFHSHLVHEPAFEDCTEFDAFKLRFEEFVELRPWLKQTIQGMLQGEGNMLQKNK